MPILEARNGFTKVTPSMGSVGLNFADIKSDVALSATPLIGSVGLNTLANVLVLYVHVTPYIGSVGFNCVVRPGFQQGS